MKDLYPLVAHKTGAYLVLPPHTAECERDISALKLIKTQLRNRLKESSLDCLIRIVCEGPDVIDYPYDKVVEKWAKLKNRRLNVVVKGPRTRPSLSKPTGTGERLGYRRHAAPVSCARKRGDSGMPGLSTEDHRVDVATPKREAEPDPSCWLGLRWPETGSLDTGTRGTTGRSFRVTVRQLRDLRGCARFGLASDATD